MKHKEKIDRSFDGSTNLVARWKQERELRRAADESGKRIAKDGRRDERSRPVLEL
ncbi:hypothetical protein [Herbaspirillum robiniae]|uniref:hypothetical protein n=1 Tax=Herbaspirillum robiniae TaxID=2014887 RepID=UPI003D77D09F